MNKIVSGIIDSYALNQMHKEKSSKSHFLAGKSQNLKPEDFLSFYKEPLTPAVKLRDIFNLIEQGYTQSQIEKRLVKTHNTLRTQIKNLKKTWSQ